MKLFEIVFNYSRLFLPALNLLVYKTIKQLVVSMGDDVSLLDVGGRKSHHTINIPAEITITDIPRESSTQVELHLGVNKEIIDQLHSRRTNIKNYIIDDMTETKLPKESYDIIMAIEVLEHVEKDSAFIENVHATLKPGGYFFMTTPNGDHVENTNPDHVRHYRKKKLISILEKRFISVDVSNKIYESRFCFYSQNSWSIRHPLRTAGAMLSSMINNFQSIYFGKVLQSHNSRHLVAIATKK